MTTTAIKPNFKYVKSENEFTVYANHTGIGISNFDIRFMFGQLELTIEQDKSKSGQAQELTVVKLGAVIMSPVHAKLVCKNLQANIEQYEKTFGKINMTPEQAATSEKK